MEEEEEQQQLADVDRISDLPDGVLIHILSLLETIDAVRTAVLSRRWKFLWAHVPSLTFHLTCADNPEMISLDGTLALHAAPKISKFHLQLRNCESLGSTTVDPLVRVAVTRHVEDLSLDLLGLSRIYALPEDLYSLHSLRELRTNCCGFFPKGRVRWESVRVLDVELGRMKGKIEDVLSGCPALEFLSLRRVRLPGGLHIVHDRLKRLVVDNAYFDPEDYKELKLHVRAPCLEELEILGDWFWTSCKLIDILSLVRVRLDFFLSSCSDNVDDRCQNAVEELVEMIQHCQELRVGIRCLGDLAEMEMKSLCATLSLRKCLVLEVRPCSLESWFKGMFGLHHCSPNLKRLVIDFKDFSDFDQSSSDEYSYGVHSDNEHFYCYEDWKFMDNASDHFLSDVKIIELYGIILDDQWFAFVNFLLKKSVVLEKMTIYPKSTKESLRNVAETLLSFPRSSLHAKVILEKKILKC